MRQGISRAAIRPHPRRSESALSSSMKERDRTWVAVDPRIRGGRSGQRDYPLESAFVLSVHERARGKSKPERRERGEQSAARQVRLKSRPQARGRQLIVHERRERSNDCGVAHNLAARRIRRLIEPTFVEKRPQARR